MKIERWTKILLTLEKLDFLGTSQIQELFDLKRENTLRILNDMKGEKLLLSRREYELIWYLSKEGIKQIGCDKQVKYVKNNIHHYILRNQVYIKFRPLNWSTETAIKWNEHKDDIIRPDAVFEYNNNLYFLEVDISQSMQVNKVKIGKYKLLKESKRLKVYPIIMYVTISEYRQKQLRAMLEPLRNEVLVYSDIK